MEVTEHDECTIVLLENIEHRTGASLTLGSSTLTLAFDNCLASSSLSS